MSTGEIMNVAASAQRATGGGEMSAPAAVKVQILPWLSEPPALQQTYTELLARAYTKMGVEAANESAAAARDSTTHGVFLTGIGGRGPLYAAARLHRWVPDERDLPTLAGLRSRCAIEPWLHTLDGPVFELSGTFVTRPWRRDSAWPFSRLVVAASVAAARLLGAGTLIGCADAHLLEVLYGPAGFVTHKTLGAHKYPSPRFETSVAFITDLETLEGAADRALVLALRALIADHMPPLSARRSSGAMTLTRVQLGTLASRGVVALGSERTR